MPRLSSRGLLLLLAAVPLGAQNNTYIHKISPGKAQASLEYVDNAAAKGESYYYVRVEQTGGQLAWSSPVWIRYD